MVIDPDLLSSLSALSTRADIIPSTHPHLRGRVGLMSAPTPPPLDFPAAVRP